MKCWNDFTKTEFDCPNYSPTNESLRAPTQYWIVSDAQLARDLKPRRLADVYRENRAGREYRKPARDARDDLAKYKAWCRATGHTPHPGSIDPDHPINATRLRMPRMVREPAPEVIEYRMAA